MRSRESRKTLVGRLATTLGLSSIGAAALALAAGMLLADVLIVRQVERSVAASARVMQVEIDEAGGAIDQVQDEARLLGIDGDVAVRSTDEPPGCGLAGDLVCSEPLATHPGFVVTVGVPADRVHGHRLPLLLAGLSVLVVVTLAARAIGAGVGRRFLAPLDRLRMAVVGVDASAPAEVELPPATSLEEIDALRDALRNLLDRLDVELGRARRFAASAAHELRTPLAKMRTELELAAEAPATETERQQMISRLTATATRLEALTERLLLLATPREALVSRQCTSMAQLVEDLAARRFASEAGRLEIRACEQDALVRGDDHLLAAMLDNLVANALEFSEGPVRVTVDVDVDRVVLEVADDGPGLPPEIAAALSEPFRRSGLARGRPGHGLGLALACHIASAHGGAIVVLPGAVGTTIRAALPAVPA